MLYLTVVYQYFQSSTNSLGFVWTAFFLGENRTMKVLSLIVLSVLCTLSQAILFSTIATVSLSLISLNKPVSGFFGLFRRRKSPVQETPSAQEFNFPNQMGGFMNPFGGFGAGAGGMFFPGMNNPGFGMFNPSNRFPPQQKPSQPQWTPQKPQMKPQMPAQPAFPPQHAFPPQQSVQFPPQHSAQFPPQGMPADMNDFGDDDDVPPGMNTEEAESFFTLLAETDESKCISRLVCEMGSNPASGGEFGQTIVEIIGSLNDFPDGSKVSEYNEVLNLGKKEGLSACISKFAICDEESFQLVKKSQLDDEQGN